MKAADVLVALCVQFALLSLLAFGGANSVVPEMHRQAVDVHHWMTGSQFAALFAIAQAAPGPNFMISTLVGWKAAGLAGALIATLAMCGPSCVLTFWVVAPAGDRDARPADRGLGDSDRLSADPRRRPRLAPGPGDRDGGGDRLPLEAQSPLAAGRRRWAGADWASDLTLERREARFSTTVGAAASSSTSSCARKVASTLRAC
jgi:hypothetical protein